nr:MAG TPA: hypothetical protein [Caudoviricetes sp.]
MLKHLPHLKLLRCKQQAKTVTRLDISADTVRLQRLTAEFTVP